MKVKRPVTPEEMREHAESLRHRAEAKEGNSSRRFDHAPGAAVTGGSGRRRSGLHRKTERAIEGSFRDLREAKALRERAATWDRRADRVDPAKLAEREERREVLAKVRRRESKQRKAAPILNRRQAPCHIDSPTWRKLHRDFRTLSVVEIGGERYRVRRAIQDGALVEVFLTDKPERTETR